MSQMLVCKERNNMKGESITNSMCVSCDTTFNKSGARCGTVCPVCRGTVREVLTGVIDNNSVPNIWDEIDSDSTVNLTYANALREHAVSCEDEDCISDDHYPETNGWDSDGDDTRLIGDWKFDEMTGDCEPDTEGKKGFAAIVRESVSQVVWSRAIAKRKSMCSPCYPMQADLDSGTGTIPCYAFPADMMEEN
jgi:hypothetical protein